MFVYIPAPPNIKSGETKMDWERFGEWIFILGVVIAIISGLAYMAMDTASANIITVVLVVLGLIVGFLNIRAKDTTGFLIAAIALVAVGAANLGDIPIIGEYLRSMVLNVVAFVAPAALVVALKSVHNLASSRSSP
jgi:magnesium-transporting ATPase (P-type)